MGGPRPPSAANRGENAYGPRALILTLGLFAIGLATSTSSVCAQAAARVPRLGVLYFVINLKTARTLTLALPPALVQRADEVVR